MKTVQKFLPVLIFSFVIVFVYQDLPKTFFQQDEWAGLGYNIYLRSLGFWGVVLKSWQGFSCQGFSRFTPLLVPLNFFQYYFFGTNFSPYALLSLILHLGNTLLVFYFFSLLFKNKKMGMVVSLLFAVNSVSHQAVTWISTYTGTQGATFFLLLSLIFFLKYQDEKRGRKYYYFSLGMLLISLGFKEITAFLFIFFPIWSLASIKKEKRWQLSWFKEQIPLIICAFFYLGLRALPLLTEVEKYSVVVDKTWGYLPITIYNLITTPLATVSQIFIPHNVIQNLVRQIPDSFFKSRFFSSIHSIPVMPATFVSLFLTFLITALVLKLILALCRRGEKRKANIILLALIWIATAALPFAFLGRPLAFLESRYYYLSTIGAALLLGMVIFYIADGVKQKLAGFKARNAVYYGLIGLLVTPILLFHSAKIRQHIKERIKVGDEQKAVLAEIKKAYPVIGKKSIFYTESLMYPTFYSGFGHTLMVVYAQEGQVNPGFFKDDFLSGIEWQGYRELEGNGFGYFRQYSKLAEAVKEFHLLPENIYAFHYDTQTKKLENITDDFKNRMKYADMIAYISRPQRGKRLLGIPDGQRRSFSSKEFVPTEIKEVINLTDNEEWAASDFIARQTRKTIPDTEDYFITYNYGLEAGYGGTYLVYHLAGNGTNVYSIPARVYGYKIAGFSGVNSSLKGNSIMEKIVQKKDGSFEVTLLSVYPYSQTIEFTLLLNAKVLYYKPGEGINDIVAGQYANAKGDGKSKKFVIPLSGILESLRSYWESNDLRYQPKAFVDGVMTQITSWNGMNTSFLTIEFEKPPARDAIIKVPILATYAPKPSDIIKIVNF